MLLLLIFVPSNKLLLLTCYLCMEFQESLQGVVGGEALDTVVGYPVLRPAFRTLDLALHVVDQALHAGLQTVGVLAWQQFRRPIPVQADTAGEQLVELLHPAGAAAELPAANVCKEPLLGASKRKVGFSLV